MGQLSYSEFCKLQNNRSKIEYEMSKLLSISKKSIEMLRPVQRKQGATVSFHIRSDASQTSEIMDVIRKESNNGYLAKVKYLGSVPYVHANVIICIRDTFVFLY